jgi:hypothetical protein
MGKLQKAILAALRAWDWEPGHEGERGMCFSDLCRATITQGCRPRTHATAVSRAVWNLAERAEPLVEVFALAWLKVTHRKTWIEDNKYLIDEGAAFWGWHGKGGGPRIRCVRVAP